MLTSVSLAEVSFFGLVFKWSADMLLRKQLRKDAYNCADIASTRSTRSERSTRSTRSARAQFAFLAAQIQQKLRFLGASQASMQRDLEAQGWVCIAGIVCVTFIADVKLHQSRYSMSSLRRSSKPFTLGPTMYPA